MMDQSELLDRVCPFHLALDGGLLVRRAGAGLRAVLEGEVAGRSIFEILSIVRPAVSSADRLRALTGTTLLCRMSQRPLLLRAQLLALGDEGFLMVATPWVTTEEELDEAGLSLGLAAPHEGWADFFLHAQLLRQQRRDLEKLVDQLEDREAHLRAIVDTAADAIISTDDGGKIERVNPAVERLIGYVPDELVGRDIRALIPLSSPMPQGASESSHTAIGTGWEITAVRKDGTTFAAEVAVSEIFVQGRRRYTSILRDISERKKLEQLQSEFVSTVSHELRTPVTSILGALGLVAGGVTGELPEDAQECIEIALANSNRLIRLINDILDMEKIQSGSMEFRMKTVELHAAVRLALAANEPFASAHGVRLTLAGKLAEGEVLVDEDRLTQVLTNFLSNAVKFSPPGGSVEVAVERTGEWFCVKVRDRGPGIPEEFRSRIFQRFAQADMSSTRQRGGTGLGLSISKAIVEMMRGRIGFELPDDGGACFFLELPRVSPVEQPP